MKKNLIPMKLQMFAEGVEGSNGQNQPDAANQGQSKSAVQIDYDKIQQMLNGTLAAKDEIALVFTWGELHQNGVLYFKDPD